MKSKFLIVEDEVFISEHLKQLILHAGHRVTDICSNEMMAIVSVTENPPDYAFLDIRLLGEETGINIGRKLQVLGIPFIYITSFTDKATIQEAIKTRPIDYIVKPFSNEEVLSAIDQFHAEERKSVTIKSGSENHVMKVDDILFGQSENVYVEIFLKSEKYLTRLKLADVIAQIADSNFVQVHRSYAVNLKHVSSFNSKYLQLGEHQIPISKTYSKLVLSLLK
jgi:DNA-binding LytR/AlgR family response regulator